MLLGWYFVGRVLCSVCVEFVRVCVLRFCGIYSPDMLLLCASQFWVFCGVWCLSVCGMGVGFSYKVCFRVVHHVLFSVMVLWP